MKTRCPHPTRHRAVVGSLLLAGACNQLERLPQDETDCVPPAVTEALARSCGQGGCHDAAGTAAGLSLTPESAAVVVGAMSSQSPLPLVTIGSTDNSYLAHKIMQSPPQPIAGSRMPIGADPADEAVAADVATILAWVAGAQLPGCEAGTGGGDPTGGETGDTGMAPAADRQLPCEVDDLLQRYCRSCHADPPIGAPMPLIDHIDLTAAGTGDVLVAQRALARMQDAAAPMPPAPASPPTAEEVAAFAAWVDAGAPAGTCDTATPTSDPFDVDPTCSSGLFWDDGLDDGDPRMNPGRDCISCHDTERLDDPDDPDIPDLVIGGTLYPTGYEPDLCIGASGGALEVVVATVDGIEVRLTPNDSGNFLLHRAEAPAGFEPPFTVKVVDGDRERVMPGTAPSGSCNGCHTDTGNNGAPGRVVVP